MAFRVLVVDGSVVVRRLVAEELSRAPELEVSTAANGRIALQKLTQVVPDLVLLDVEMPERDGPRTLAELRTTHPRLPVVLFSSPTEAGAEATLDALALGATDYFTKPAGTGPAAREVVRTQLAPALEAICARAAGPAPSAVVRTAPSAALRPGPVEVVAVGASTGGPNALAEAFARLPADFPVPIVVVQHMPPLFTRLLAERLSANHSLRFHEGAPGAVLEPGHVWIAPGDHHMVVVRDGAQVHLSTNQGPPECSCRPAVDPLFRSVAQAYGPRALAVVLTGMGQDGLRGCEAVRAAGGAVLVQDEATSVVWGMPGYVARAGLASRVLPLGLIGDAILSRVLDGRAGRPNPSAQGVP